MINFITEVFRQVGIILLESSPYLLFGFLVAGLIHAYLPPERISRYLGGRNLRSVFNAGLLGVPLPLCSCSVIPTAISLRRSGASRGATMAFLISTPETGVDSIGVSFALLDPLMTFFRPLAALITAVTAGVGANFLDSNNKDNGLFKTASPVTECQAESCCDSDSCRISPLKDQSLIGRFRLALKFSFGELLDDLAVWFIIGLLFAALIGVLIPDDFFAGSLGHGIWSLVLMLIIGMPLYTCATASTPIAAALIMKGLSPGAALVFLLASPATNIGSLLILSRYFERRFMVLYLATIAVVSLALGLLLNLIYSAFHLDVRAALGKGSEFVPAWLAFFSAVILGYLLSRSLIKTKTFPKLWLFCKAKTLAFISALTQ